MIDQETAAGHAETGPALLRVNEAAQYLGFSPSKVWQLIHDGALPAVKIGFSVRIKRTDLDAWIRDLPTMAPTDRRRRPAQPYRLKED